MDSRITKLIKLLDENSLDALFVSSLPNITYLTGFAGFSNEDRDAFLLITHKHQYIFTHGIYKEAVKRQVKNFDLIDIKRESPISASLGKLVEEEQIGALGFEAFDLRVAEYDRLTKQLNKDILSPSNIVEKLRIRKSPEELQALKHACKLGDKAFTYILSEIKLGITESELAAQLDFYIKSQGAINSFPTIIAFEENAAHPHHMPTNKKLEKNNLVLMDFGVRLNNYCSDMTRTVSFGKATQEKKYVYETVKIAQHKAIEFLNSHLPARIVTQSVAGGSTLNSIKGSDVDSVARNHITSQGFPTMPHSLGHGIGLEVHESPRLTPVTKERIDEGMVFSIEPGIYLLEKFGVRIEDLFAIENHILVPLTQSKRILIEI